VHRIADLQISIWVCDTCEGREGRRRAHVLAAFPSRCRLEALYPTRNIEITSVSVCIGPNTQRRGERRRKTTTRRASMALYPTRNCASQVKALQRLGAYALPLRLYLRLVLAFLLLRMHPIRTTVCYSFPLCCATRNMVRKWGTTPDARRYSVVITILAPGSRGTKTVGLAIA
jgi:hypothetical protein